MVYYWVSVTRMKGKKYDDQSKMTLKFNVIWCLVSPFKSSKFKQQPHDLECSLQGQRKKKQLNVTKVL